MEGDGLEMVKSLLKTYKDFPKKGIEFIDINPIMSSHNARSVILHSLVERYKGTVTFGDDANGLKSRSILLQDQSFSFSQQFRNLDRPIDAIVALESRGYYFGILLAHALELPFIPVRKSGKLPGKCLSQSFEMEYEHVSIEVQEEALEHKPKVLIMDDIMATGNSCKAVIDLLTRLGVEIVEVNALIELTYLNGSKNISREIKFNSLIKI